MNKKGMTVVELVVSFSLTTVIALFLIQVVLFLKDTYAINGVKSEIILNQSIISDRLNSLFAEKKILFVDNNCGDYCIDIIFYDSSMSTINFDVEGNRVIIDDYVASLPSGTHMSDIAFSITNIPELENTNNGIFSIKATLTNDLIRDESFNINAIYQFNSEENNLSLD